MLPTGAAVADDTGRQPVILFPSEWSLRYFAERNAGVDLHATPAGKAEKTDL